MKIRISFINSVLIGAAPWWLLAASASGMSPVFHEAPLGSSMDHREDVGLLVDPQTVVSQEGENVERRFAPSGAAAATYAAENLPPGLSIEPESGIVTGTLTQDAAGSYQVRLRAQNQDRIATMGFTWFILEDALPEVASPGLVITQVGDPVDVVIFAQDDDADDLTYKAYGLPRGLSIDSQSGQIAGRLEPHSVLTTYNPVIQVSDGHVSGGVVFSWVVSPHDH